MSMLSVGSDSRRPGGVRACVLPLLVFFVFVVGYLIGSWSSPLSTNPVTFRQFKLTDKKAQPAPDQSKSNLRPSQARAASIDAPLRSSGEKVVGRIPVPPTKTNKEPRGQQMEYEVVVSHYNEPLDWLRPYATKAGHVYHKGQQSGPPFDMYKWERLPNVGRESHTYLHHILQNYNSLADVTIFVQGHGPENPWCFRDPQEFVTNAKNNIFCRKQGTYGGWGRINHFGKWLADLNSGRMRRAKTTVGEFYTALFGTPPPPAVPRCLAGCFAATKETLHRHPLSFYQKAISFVNDHPNPEEGHYFERLWATIVNTK
ncbi:uncharacterized protein LOC110975458 isoform X4 [Acanthaster planci]|uniref:Uncharacterized protein LOC110975458 isoform X4 n=1 Tax=Acanthaster planci TaxID=133434 RepID=A0A8B7XS38_ACAPL|nr:uncharacterized protein LOC110975458 isoform X4 [Acanthaster planci]